MSQPSSVRSRMPLIVAVACALLVAALVVAFLHVHSVGEQHAKQGQTGYGLTTDQQDAVTAAATEAANVITFSRKTFDADFARALAGTTGALKSDLTGKKALTLSTMTSGKFDLKGTVGSAAYVGPAEPGPGLFVLVTVNGYQVADAKNGSTNSVQRFEMTMVKVGKLWLASNLNSVGIQ